MILRAMRGSIGFSAGTGAGGTTDEEVWEGLEEEALTVLRIRESSSKSGREEEEEVDEEDWLGGSAEGAGAGRGVEIAVWSCCWARESRGSMAATGGIPGGSGRKSCLGMGMGIRSSGLQSTALAKEGLFKTKSFLIWLNCWSCERGSRKAMPIKGSNGIGIGLSLSILSPSSSSVAAEVRGGGLYTSGGSGLDVAA